MNISLAKLISRNSFVFIILVSFYMNCYADYRSNNLEGFNWYNEKDLELEKEDNVKSEVPSQKEELPEYEKNIRSLQARHKAAHRRALDNPTKDNLLEELRLEKEMMNKSKIYAERRVAVAAISPEYIDMKSHSNVLHRSVQERVEKKEMDAKLNKLSQRWGLILQIQDDCLHCHTFAPIVLEFANKYGFELLAASASGNEFKGISGVVDSGEMVMFNPKRETPILYLVKMDGKEVFPISRGINSEMQIILNIEMIDKQLRKLF